MGFEFSSSSQQLQERLSRFMDDHIYPNEHAYAEQLANAQNRYAALPLMDELKSKAQAEGLWNLFVPTEYGHFTDHGGLSFLDYAPLAETMGRVLWAP